MKPFLRLFFAVTSLAATAFAQQAPPEIHVTSPTTLDAEWAGEPHRVYFVQWSPDLVNWELLPVMRFGEAMHEIGANIDGAQGFFRLLHYDDLSLLDLAAAKLADHDDDGLSNWEEIAEHFTNPQNSDSDGDGITDGGEFDQYADPNDPNDTPEAEWFILTGYDEENVVMARIIGKAPPPCLRTIGKMKADPVICIRNTCLLEPHTSIITIHLIGL